MGRIYVRKTNRASYTQEAMQEALNAITSGQLSKRKASKQYGIPRPTLIKRLKNVEHQPTSLGRFRPVFDSAFDRELVDYALEMQRRCYGLSVVDLRRLAFQLAEKNNIPHPFSKTMQMAGKEWAFSFLRRHTELSLRSPEATSMSRMTGFNRVQVNKFYELLREEFEKEDYSAHQIFNVDESGITTVQKPGKIIAKRGLKQVGKAVSAEKGMTTTIVCAMSASGVHVPPMLLFRRKNMNDRLMKGCPPGAIGYPSPKGWMTNEIFIKYMEHFIKHVKPLPTQKILLLLDGHQSHKTIEIIDLARANNITMITLPPHTSHRLQPLDVTFFGPLKTFYNREIDHWMLRNPGKRVSDYDIVDIFRPAYLKATTPEKGIHGFEKTGIFPFNPDIFKEEDFAASLVTERPHEINNSPSKPTSVTRATTVSVDRQTPPASATTHPKAKRARNATSVDRQTPPASATTHPKAKRARSKASVNRQNSPQTTIITNLKARHKKALSGSFPRRPNFLPSRTVLHGETCCVTKSISIRKPIWYPHAEPEGLDDAPNTDKDPHTDAPDASNSIAPEELEDTDKDQHSVAPDASNSIAPGTELEDTDKDQHSVAPDASNSIAPEKPVDSTPTTSTSDNATNMSTFSEISRSSPKRYSVLNVSPYPHVAAADTSVQPMVLRRKRKAQVSCVLTSSPYKNELLAKVVTGPKANKAVVTTRKNNKRGRKGSGSDFDLSKKVGCKNFEVMPTYACIYCKKLCDDNNLQEDWVKCKQCQQWCHEACAPIERGKKAFICDFCYH